MENLIRFTRPVDLTNFTLIIPTISVANVGQLSVDLLITSHRMQKVGILWDPAIVPCVGADPFNSNSSEVCTACELYVNEELKLAAIQLRSTIEVGLALHFFNKLITSLTELKCKQVIILTSVFAHELHDINSGLFRFISNNQTHSKKLLEMNIMEFEQLEDESYIIYGGGFASKLYEMMQESLKVTVIIKYASEGDNRPDAEQTLQVINNLLELEKVDVRYPDSWQFVFGNPPPIGLF